jgi:hypothetical protein
MSKLSQLMASLDDIASDISSLKYEIKDLRDEFEKPEIASRAIKELTPDSCLDGWHRPDDLGRCRYCTHVELQPFHIEDQIAELQRVVIRRTA